MGKEVINKTFNAILFFYLLCMDSAFFIFEPRPQRNAPWYALYDASPSMAIGVAVLILLVLLIWGAVLGRVFWNRWVADVFKVREITYDEAMALILMFAILVN